ncbi:MAG: cobalt chelatase [Ideonella sp.]
MTEPGTTTPASTRAQQRVEELCAAAIRAISGERDLFFRSRRLHRGNRALPLFGPHLQPSLEHDDFASFRGAADGIALRLRWSNAALHRSLCPADPVERWVFELLEQCRVEAMAQADMPGIAHNLRHRFEAWSADFHHSRLTETSRGMLLYTVAQVARSWVIGTRVMEETEDLIESTRISLSPLIGTALAGLRRERLDQQAYAVFALDIAERIAARLRIGNEPASATETPDDDPDDSSRENDFKLLIDFDAEVDDGMALATSGSSKTLSDAVFGYRVFTTQFDQEVFAASLVRRAELDDFRDRIDRRIARQGLNVARLSRRLQAMLARPVIEGWDDEQEAGRIDGRRLTRLITSPAERRLFRTDRQIPRADSAVCFLIDCSGSMKQHIEGIAMLVDVFVRALELAGIDSEVLGYTTGAWNGGRAIREWRRAGKPPFPGRLNERRHLIFKDAQRPWRRARRDIAALLKPDIFREGIDGEAVEWACNRLDAAVLGEDGQRRLLFVISDGSPMDGATALANDDHYLDQHLREVVEQRSAPGGVEIYGIGVGLDLSPYYRRNIALDLSVALGNPVFDEILQLIDGATGR